MSWERPFEMERYYSWLDISDNNVPNAVERIADWLEQTGGPYM